MRGYGIFEHAKKKVSGLAKRARYVMSHESGKIEIVGVDEQHIYLRYHRARDPRDEGRFLVCRRDDQAHWLADLVAVEGLGGRLPVLPPSHAAGDLEDECADS